MNRTRTAAALILTAVLAIGRGARDLDAATWYVATNGNDSALGSNGWGSALATIANAVARTTDGDTVVISNGVYHQTSRFDVGNSITITSIKGDLTGALETVIKGNGSGNYFGIYFYNSPSTARLCGLAITDFYHPDGQGGAIWINGANSRVSLKNCFISGNTGNFGGGICVTGNGKLWASNCVISGNTAVYTVYAGGGVHVTGTGSGSSRFYDCIISNNVSNGTGGGGMLDYPNNLFVNCAIVNNRCAGQGGGVYMSGNLLNCRILGNSAGAGGGGVSMYYGADGNWIKGCLIANNSALAWGGGVYLATTPYLPMINCTVVSNTGSRGGGALRCSAVNSIVYFNKATQSGYEFSSNNYSDVGGAWTNCCTAPIPPAGTYNCIASDPLFVDRAAGNFRLTLASRCADAGLYQPWMADAQDLDGRPRVQRGAVDIGAYELAPGGTAIFLY